ncbi:MAG: sulfite exporter TauE/SafE family protein, partial [Chitinophagaceae bacterium]
SLFGFLFSLKQFDFNWTVLIGFTVLAIAGLFIGGRLSDKIDGSSLRKGFAWFILIMGVYVVIKELYI